MKHLIVYVVETDGDKEPHTVQLHGDFANCKCIVKRRMGWGQHLTDADLDKVITLFFGVNNKKSLLHSIAAAVRSEFDYSRGVIQSYLDKLAESRQELHVGLKCDKEEKEQSTLSPAAAHVGAAVKRVREGQSGGD